MIEIGLKDLLFKKGEVQNKSTRKSIIFIDMVFLIERVNARN